MSLSSSSGCLASGTHKHPPECDFISVQKPGNTSTYISARRPPTKHNSRASFPHFPVQSWAQCCEILTSPSQWFRSSCGVGVLNENTTLGHGGVNKNFKCLLLALKPFFCDTLNDRLPGCPSAGRSVPWFAQCVHNIVYIAYKRVFALLLRMLFTKLPGRDLCRNGRGLPFSLGP